MSLDIDSLIEAGNEVASATPPTTGLFKRGMASLGDGVVISGEWIKNNPFKATIIISGLAVGAFILLDRYSSVKHERDVYKECLDDTEDVIKGLLKEIGEEDNE